MKDDLSAPFVVGQAPKEEEEDLSRLQSVTLSDRQDPRVNRDGR
jgi:hypothetical protein